MTKRVCLSVLIALMLILSSCNFPLTADKQVEEENDTDLLATAVAGTMQAMSLQSQAQAEQQAAAAQAEAPAQVEAAPTATLFQPTVPAVISPTITTQACNQAVFYSETVPDGTQFNLGENFTKTWTFTNTGTCTWNTNYKLVYVSGDQMSGPVYVYFPQTVAPQTNVTISVNLIAPFTEGTYTGYWALQGEDGVIFHSNNSVKIEASRSAFRVESVTTDLQNHSPDGCPYDLHYWIKFTSTSAGKMNYYILDSEGGETANDNVTFSGAETKKVTQLWSGLNSGSYWIKVYVDTPNHQWFGPYKFTIECP